MAEEKKRGKKKRKMKMSGRVFVVVIAVVLLMALTINVVSAGSPVKVSVTPVNQVEELNPSGPYKEKLNPSEPMAFTDERAVNELIYDDGVAENAYYMSEAYNGFAVRFTPPSYPAEIITAKICFWPDGTHEEFAVYVYDDDGLDGQPGTCLGRPIKHIATEGGWCYVDLLGLDISLQIKSIKSRSLIAHEAERIVRWHNRKIIGITRDRNVRHVATVIQF